MRILLLTTICSISFAFTRNNAVRTCPRPRRFQCGAAGETSEFPDWSSFLQTEAEQERNELIGAFSESFEELWSESEWSSIGKEAKAARLGFAVTKKMKSVATWEVLTPNLALQALEILESEIPDWFQNIPKLKKGHVSEGFEEEFEVLKRFVTRIFQDEQKIDGSNGMSVWRNIPSLEVSSAAERDIVIRNITVPLWASVLEKVDVEDKQYRVAVIGTPGTGKTTTTAVLIQMLLKRKKKVIYHIRAQHFIFEMTPSSDGRIELSVHDVYISPDIMRVVPSLKNRNAYYVVDPGKVQENCDPSPRVRAKVIIVTSPNPTNWGKGNFDKERDDSDGFFYHHPLWTLEEIQVARNYIRPELNLSEDDLFDRFRQVGGVPRHIFSTDEKYEEYLEKQSSALTEVDPFLAVNIAQGNADPLNRPGEKQLKSAILGYNLKEPGNFAKKKIVVISPSVTEQIVNKHKSAVWGEMRALGEKGWWLFEAISRSVMTERQREFECRPCVGKSDKRYEKFFKVTLGGCTGGFRLVVDPVASAKEKENVVFHSLNTKHPLIDFIYRDATGYHAFQVTIGQTHTAKAKDLKDLSERFEDGDKVTLYYIVPSYNFMDFTTSPVKPELPNGTILHAMVPDPSQDVDSGSTTAPVYSE